jgi:hypothetical protein
MPPRRQGAAFVEIIADTDGFEKRLQKSLDDSVKEASKSKNFTPLVDALGDAGDKAGDEFGKRFDKRNKNRVSGSGFLSVLRAPFKAAFSALSQIAGKAFVAGFNAFTQSADLAGGLVTNLGKGISGAFASLASSGPVGLAILTGGLLAGLGAFVAFAPLVVSAVFAIGGALFSLLGVLNAVPATFAIATAALIPLVLAFGGFGEALTAIGQGDLEKTNEALKKLSPSARGVAREFQKLQPFFKTLQQDVQEAFFSRLTGSLTALQKALGPAVSGGLQNVAFALGGFVDQLLKLASKPETANLLSRIFETVSRIITDNGPAVVRFLEAIGAAIGAALPSIEKFAGKLGDAFAEFGDFIIEKVEDGSFQEFLDSAFITLEKIGVVLLEVLGLFSDMFATTDESGQTFLDDVAEAVRKLREFFQSPEGKEFIENMITLAEDFGDILIFIVGVIADIVRGFARVIEIVDDVADAIDRLLGKGKQLKGIGAVGSAVSAAARAALPRFAEGGITSGPSIAGEAGPEAVLPLNNPVRAAQVAQEAGLAGLIGGAGNTVLFVTIDGQQLQGRIDRTVRANNAGLARQLSNGPRGLAVA